MTNPGPSLKAKVAFLSRPDSYEEHPARIETIQTHMSWVFMTGHFVYKLKKPVRYDLLDFSTLDARHYNCQEEVRLNRRLAPEVYLGVVPLSLDDKHHMVLDGNGKTVEWLVKMRRLPAERMLDYLIARQCVDEQDIRKFSRKLAIFYREAQTVSITQDEYRQRFLYDIRANHKGLLEYNGKLPADQLDRITEAQLGLLNTQPEQFDRRVEEKRIIEAHGDLRPEHVCLIEEPVIIDCLEFNRKLRILDPAYELANLVMECQLAGADYIEPVIFDTYCHETGDDPPQVLILFYKAYRATVRAKLSIWHLKDHEVSQHAKWIERAKAYLNLAEDYSALL